jgi:predicted enzyme related to lactoylglutathione lyase
MTMSKFVWFEYVSSDAPKAQGFYGELFGWGTKTMPLPGGNYTAIAQGDATIGGYLPPSDGAKQATWLTHLRVDNAKDAAQKAKSLGGKILVDAEKIGTVGTKAVVADPHGGVLALWQPTDPKEQSSPEANGRFCWNELASKDAAASVAFYKALGGFQTDSMEMGPEMGTYHLLKTGDTMIAGIMKAPMAEAPHAWTPYVQVANADATADKAKRLGAHVIVPPTDVPNVGRFAIFADPQGAVIGVLQN